MKKTLLMLTLCLGSMLAMAGGYELGEKVKDFKLKNVDGKMMSLADLADAKGAIVIFTCNHCPYAKAYEDRIIALNKEYAPKGYPVVAINPNDPTIVPSDSYELMQERAKKKGFTFPYLIDEKQEVYKEFGATRTPHVFVLKKSGEGMELAYIGAIDDNYVSAKKVKVRYVEDAIKAIEAGQAPNPAETKAIGCTIKAKS